MSYAILSMSASLIAKARHHCSHGMGSSSYAVPAAPTEPRYLVTYIQGTPQELRDAAARLIDLADRQDRDAAAGVKP